MNADYLLIDVGNGRIKLGLSTRADILDRRELPTQGVTVDALREAATGWEFIGVVACSVVPRVTPLLRAAFGDHVIELTHATRMPVGIRYPDPETIGPDRLADAVALAEMHGAPGIAIDFGTAVTFDVLSADRHYIGGVIAPGLRLMTDYLHERTALLPRVELREPGGAIGQTTEGAIQAGAAIGYRGMVQGILDAVRRELEASSGGAAVHLVATGGDAQWIISGMGGNIPVDPDLTLHGLRLVGNLHSPLP